MFPVAPQMLSDLIEDWILFLFLSPIDDISGGQPCWLSLHRHLLGTSLWDGNRPESLLSMLFHGHDSVVEYSFDPWVRYLVQVLLNLFIRESLIHPTQEVSHRVVLTFLVLQGEVVASETSYPSLPCSIQIGR